MTVHSTLPELQQTISCLGLELEQLQLRRVVAPNSLAEVSLDLDLENGQLRLQAAGAQKLLKDFLWLSRVGLEAKEVVPPQPTRPEALRQVVQAALPGELEDDVPLLDFDGALISKRGHKKSSRIQQVIDH